MRGQFRQCVQWSVRIQDQFGHLDATGQVGVVLLPNWPNLKVVKRANGTLLAESPGAKSGAYVQISNLIIVS